jgi:type IV pilus assembly protein PilY1
MSNQTPTRSSRTRTRRATRWVLPVLGTLGMLHAAHAFDPTNQDIDLFMVNPTASSTPANVLILLDNTANWSTPFAAEKQALSSVVQGLDDAFRVGVMMFPETGGGNDSTDGGYVRFGLRDMGVAAHRTALSNLVTAFDQTGDKGNNATFSLLMYEAFQYYTGGRARAGFGKVKRDYWGNAAGNAYAAALPGNAFSSSADQVYDSPVLSTCQKHYMILISNGPANDNSSSLNAARTLLTGIQGGAPATINLPSPNDGSENNWTDEYARFMAEGDCIPSTPEKEHVYTYVIEVNPGATSADLNHTALMKSTALHGKGGYFAVSTSGGAGELIDTLGRILNEIRAVNTVFAAATLPVSVNVRGANANQVYMGVFRPDETFRPRWFGNMKLYNVGLDRSVTPPSLFLADATGAAAESSSGFIRPTARSFWTEDSSFWSFRLSFDPSDVGRHSDSPDGPIVEKGGVAQQVRATLPTNRRVYTCAGGCSTGQLLSSNVFNVANGAITAAALGAASATERDAIIAWTRGADLDDENANGSQTDMRASVHGDVLHSQPAVINYNRSGSGDDDIVVYYGSGDGALHAVTGAYGANGGEELWAFIAPEHFGRLKRLRDNSPMVSPLAKKSYFFDGPIATYTLDVNGDGRLNATDGDKVQLFASMRRGGRYLYAFDVSNPAAPVFMWKKGCPNAGDNVGCDAGFAELGQTWSEPSVTYLRPWPTTPVLVVGAGYDAAVEDLSPCLITGSTSSDVTSITGADVTYNLTGGCTVVGGTSTTTLRSKGRGIFVIDSQTGAVLWRAGPAAPAAAVVAGMDYSIPGRVVAIDRDRDSARSLPGTENISAGYADRLYATDTAGNIWRVDVAADSAADWRVSHLASLGGGGANPRKFLHRVDVVYARDDYGAYDAVLIGSGDREHPFDTTVLNRFYMIKDRNVLPSIPGTTTAAITDADLLDANSNCVQQCTGVLQVQAQADLLAAQGWRFDLRPGEKTVGAATTLSNSVFFNTNQPAAATCENALGIAREYRVHYADASAVRDLDFTGDLDVADRSAEHAGGGLLPDPVPLLVEMDGEYHQGVVIGPSVRDAGSVPFGARLRTNWNKRLD